MAERTDDIVTERHQGPDDLRREIARTRADMDRTLAAIEERVSPSRIKDRQVDRFRGRWERTREAVMGSADDGPGLGDRAGQVSDQMGGHASELGDRASETAHQLADSTREAPQRLEETTRGNPIATGLVAFGLGAIAGSLAPASTPERKVAQGLREEFEEPVRAELQSAGEEMKQDLQSHAEQAVQETKETAQRGKERTTEEAQQHADQLQGQAKDAADEVQQRR